MKAKFTPGPWWVEPEEASEHRGLVICAEDAILTTITPAEDGPGLDEIDRANARLIAAAPDLLGALRAIVARIDGVWDDPDLMAFGELLPDTETDIEAIASQAIAKATGA